eukprot:2756060-Karenia_brevis.AAC.1
MRCECWSWLLDVISFSSAISVCEKGGQWQHVAPLLRESAGIGSVKESVLGNVWNWLTQGIGSVSACL